MVKDILSKTMLKMFGQDQTINALIMNKLKMSWLMDNEEGVQEQMKADLSALKDQMASIS